MPVSDHRWTILRSLTHFSHFKLKLIYWKSLISVQLFLPIYITKNQCVLRKARLNFNSLSKTHLGELIATPKSPCCGPVHIGLGYLPFGIVCVTRASGNWWRSYSFLTCPNLKTVKTRKTPVGSDIFYLFLTWGCWRQRSPCAPEGERRRPGRGGTHSGTWTDTRSPRVPVGSPAVGRVRWTGKREGGRGAAATPTTTLTGPVIFYR